MCRKRLILIVSTVALLLVVVIGAILLFLTGALWPEFQPRRTVDTVERGTDLRNCSVAKLDLHDKGNILRTVGFNQRTTWPRPDRLPPDFVPNQVLSNAMNPGLGIRELHKQGITGKGVSVAIIDYPIIGQHPEFAANIAEIHHIGGAMGTSMHGPAVASLLVGRNCGTAPGAKLYFLATPDPGGDARHQAAALDWVIQKNTALPPADRIRVVSVSAGPSGPGSPFRNGAMWDEAVGRAEKSGLLVIDGTLHHGFTGPCNLDFQAIDDVTRCTPIPTQRGLKTFADRLLVPVAPRTVTEEYSLKVRGYHYCGMMQSTRGMFGTSWSMPYCAGVAAMGWQVNPAVPAPRVKQLLFASAYVRPDGMRVINPVAFIQVMRQEPTS